MMSHRTSAVLELLAFILGSAIAIALVVALAVAVWTVLTWIALVGTSLTALVAGGT